MHAGGCKQRYELLDFQSRARCIICVIHVGWAPHFVGGKPEVCGPTY
jgi:hypothetical protein